MNETCNPTRRLLARSSLCSIEQCSCGTLHVSIGVFTVRLQAEVVASVWQTMGEALARLGGGCSHETFRPVASRFPERPS